MDILRLVISGVILLVGVISIIIAFRNYFLIKDNYKINKLSAKAMGLCGNFVRPQESLRRKNDGDDPCNIYESIQFVNYFKDSDIFIKEDIYERTNR